MKNFRSTFVMLFVLFLSLSALSQATSASGSATLNYSVSESITVTNFPTTITLPASGLSSAQNVAYSYAFIPANHTLKQIWSGFYVGSASAALAGAANVPSSALTLSTSGEPVGQVGAFNFTGACNQNAGVGPQGQLAIPGAAANTVCAENEDMASFTNTPGNVSFSFQIGFVNGFAPIAAGSYTGTLNYSVWVL